MDMLQVPVVDVGALMACADDAAVDNMLRDGCGDLQQTIAAVRAAASEWGFFYIAHHGLSEAEMTAFQIAMRAFFRLPTDVKNSIKRTANNSRGYFNDELTKNKTDWKEALDFAGEQEDGPASSDSAGERLGQDQNQWPSESTLPGFHHEMVAYFGKMEHISRRLLKMFAVALGEEATFFDQFFHGDNSSFLRLNHYPVAPEPKKTMGVHHHTDAGALTVLLQDDEVASLQVFHRESQTWHLIPPRKSTFVINIGDMVQVWSNDQFVAPLHRVLANGEAERFSAPFFYNPSYKAQVGPIVIRDGAVAQYRPLSWREFRLQRFQGDYADSGKEIQISDFKIHT